MSIRTVKLVATAAALALAAAGGIAFARDPKVKPAQGDLPAAPEASDLAARPQAGDLPAAPEAGNLPARPEASDLAANPDAGELAVKPAMKSDVGSYLTDAKGMTLYVFKKDTPGKSACAGPCASKWPLYYREKLGALGTLKAEDFASIARDDGRKQTTYRGLPLYYFAGDKNPGDTNGQGVNDAWFVASP